MDLAWDRLYETILHYADKHCPLRTFTRLNKLPTWLVPELLELMKERDQIYQQARKLANINNWNKARQIRNLCNREIRNAKNAFVIKQLETHEKDARKFWATLNEVYPSKIGSSKSNKEVTLVINDETLPPDQTADYMNDFLCKVGSKLANNIPHTPYKTEIPLHQTSFVLPTITLDETIEAISSIRIYKSSAFDGLTSRILKDSLLALPEHLQFIFNLSLSTGVFPSLWKNFNSTV